MTGPLPDGYVARPATMRDARAVYEVHAACERTEHGIVDIAPEDVITEWAQPSLDLSRDTVVVLHGESVVARAELFEGLVRANVHPDHQGRGVGAWLLAWSEQRARETGTRDIRQILHDDNARAIALLDGRGYEPLHRSWLLGIALDGEQRSPRVPEGYAFRAFDAARDARACHAVIQDAFSEWPGHVRKGFEDWAATSIEAAGFAPWQILTIVNGGAIVGTAWLLEYADGPWIQELAVEASHRGRGLGRALLEEAFRSFAERGHTTAGLSTDSRTGMLSLYEHVGMRVSRSFTSYAKRVEA